MRLNHCDALVFGKAIQLTVHPKDSSPVEPTLSILSALQPEGAPPDTLGDEVCLAAGFRPKGGKMVLNVKDRQVNESTDSAVLSRTEKAYFYVGFIDETIYSCELENTVAKNVDKCSSLHPGESSDTTERPAAHNQTSARGETVYPCQLNNTVANNDNVDKCSSLHPEKAKLNFFLLLMNGARVVFFKTLAFSTIFTIRAVL
ncbi:uncharacterized protein trdc [Chaetodon auriga]|uniref:uncharacterized protein trdc n=1 Tax=Chaetodon auriga TaxID=39042 RepID=UPI0040328DD8